MVTPDEVRSLATEFHDDAVRIRRHLHRHPELSFHETGTARFIADELDALGIPHRTGVAGNGIVATVTGSNAGCARDARVVALRADMDALPIDEVEGREYGSQTPGVMHACGHDGHSTSVLTTARILHSLRERFSGSVKVLFQPAEERVPGGALGMIREGVLESPSVDRVFGQHVNTELPVGSVGFRSGLFMASADEIYITIRGQGGHAAKPHLGVDPIAISAQLIVALQLIVSRSADPIVPSVLTFGRIIGDGAANVIPDVVRLDGTFRTVDETWRAVALDRIERTTRAIVEGLGGSVEIRIDRGYPMLINDAEATRLARSAAEEYLGRDRVVELPPALWAEDFAYFAGERPACFYNLGVRNEERGIVHAVHTPRFDLDEQALRVGSGLMAWIAIRTLEEGDRIALG